MRASDAGDASFVRQVVPILHGRRASYDEVRVYSDTIAALGGGASARRQIVFAMMEDDAYVAHWDALLSEHLRVVRSGDQSLGGCYNDDPGALQPASMTPNLARDLRGPRPAGSPASWTTPNPDPKTTSVGAGANMTSVLRSAIRADDLSVAWRAHLFAFASRPLAGAAATTAGIREDFAKKFLANYVERDLACTSCHNSSWSTTGEQTWWDRTWAMPVYVERSLFGSHNGGDIDAVGAFFPGDNVFTTTGTAPWGLSCGQIPTTASPESPTAPGFANATTAPQGTVWDLDAAFARGVWKLSRDGLNRRSLDPVVCGSACLDCSAPPVPAGPGLAELRDAAREALIGSVGSCNVGCHSSGWSGDLDDPGGWDEFLIRQQTPGGRAYIVPRHPEASELVRRIELPVDHAEHMPDNGTVVSDAGKAAIRAYINALPSQQGCDGCDTTICDGAARDADGDEMFAFATAAGIVNFVFSDVFGKPLTVVNDFPRNPHELQVYSSLTNQLVYVNGSGGWSLKSTLASLLTSKLFNRLPPSAADGEQPYELPLLLDPWTEGDPRSASPPDPPDPSIPPPPPRDRGPLEIANAMTEGVHRHAPDTLLRSAAHSLSWTTPRRFVLPTSGYPTRATTESVGSFINYAQPGTDSMDFQSMLSWETAVGRCQPPTPSPDWIDSLMTRIGLEPGTYTYRQLVLAVKDRLISDPTISTSISDPSDPFDDDRPLTPAGVKSEAESDVLHSLYGVATLDTPITGSGATLEDKTRLLCGALLDTPQFWLAGIARRELGENPGVFPSTYTTRCAELRTRLAARGVTIECHPDSVTLKALYSSVRDRLGTLCPGGSCGTVPWLGDSTCTSSPHTCITEPPACDPRCADLTCCGESDTVLPSNTDSALYAWHQGSKILQASGVTLRRAKSSFAPESAKPGTVLELGDWLTIPPGAKLVLDDGIAQYSTPPNGALPKTNKGQGVWTLLVAGMPDLGAFDPLAEKPVPYPLVQKLIQTERLRWGAAGKRRNDKPQPVQPPKQ